MLGFWRFAGRLGHFFIASCLVLPAFAAPEHVHEADDHHQEALAHRHFEPHDRDHHHDDDAAISERDRDVIWIDVLGIQQTTCDAAGAPATPAERLVEVVPDRPSWTATVSYASALPHGPPRAFQPLRAPPLPPV